MSDVASAPAGSPAAGRARRTAPSPRPSPAARPQPPAAPVPAGPVNAAQPPPQGDPAEPPAASSPSVTAAGTLLAGRYRLHTRVGSDTAAGAEFWRAEDTVLQRDVGGHRAAQAGPGGRRDRRRVGPDRCHPGRRDGGPRAALGQLRARRVRPAARRAGPRGLPDPGRRARRRGHRVGARPQPRRADRRRHDPPAGRRPRGGPAGRGGRGGAPARPGAGLRPPAADPDHPGRPRAAVLRAAPPGRHAGRRRARPRRDPVHAADLALAAGRHRRGAGRPGPGRAAPHVAVSSPRRGCAPGYPSSWTPWSRARSDRRTSRATCAPRPRCTGCSNEVVAEDDRIALFPPAHDGVPSSPGDVWQDGNRPPTRPTRSAGATWRSGWARSASAVLLVLGYFGVQLTSVFSEGGRPAHRGLRRRPAGADRAGDPAAGSDGQPRRAGRGGAAVPPASRSTTAAATGTTTAGSPG